MTSPLAIVDPVNQTGQFPSTEVTSPLAIVDPVNQTGQFPLTEVTSPLAIVDPVNQTGQFPSMEVTSPLAIVDPVNQTGQFLSVSQCVTRHCSMSEVDDSCESVEVPFCAVPLPDFSKFLRQEINPQSSASSGTAGLSVDTSVELPRTKSSTHTSSNSIIVADDTVQGDEFPETVELPKKSHLLSCRQTPSSLNTSRYLRMQ